MHVDGLIEGRKCGCGNAPILDMFGHHLAHGCNWKNCNNIIHDGIKTTLKSILQSAGNWCILEERQLFEGSNNRPDITIYNYNGTGQRLLLDTSCTTTHHVTRAGELNIPNNAVNTGQAAQSMFQVKNAKYIPLCTAAGFGFLPIIFETNGYAHKEVLTLLDHTSKKASDTVGIPAGILYNYYLKLLSVSMQRGLAASIITKLSSVIRTKYPDYALDADAIRMEQLNMG
jgi:hypothetical protein